MPTMIHIQTLPTISRTASIPALMRSTTEIEFGRDFDGASAHVADPFLQPAFEMQPADHPARNDRDAESESQIGQRHLPADQSEQKPERDLVDHRRGNQERESHAQRHAGRDEADEQRHRRAGTERREDAEPCRGNVAECPRACRRAARGCAPAKKSCARRPCRRRPASAASAPSGCHRRRTWRLRRDGCRGRRADATRPNRKIAAIASRR